MSLFTKKLRQKRKDERAAMIRAGYRLDALQGDNLRKMAGNAHVLSHHAADMEMAGSHAAAMRAHEKVADMHKSMAKGCDDYDSKEFPSSDAPSSVSSESSGEPSGQSSSKGPSRRPSPPSSGAPSSAPESSGQPSAPDSSKPASSVPSSSEMGPSTPAGHKRVMAFVPKKS